MSTNLISVLLKQNLCELLVNLTWVLLSTMNGISFSTVQLYIILSSFWVSSLANPRLMNFASSAKSKGVTFWQREGKSLIKIRKKQWPEDAASWHSAYYGFWV